MGEADKGADGSMFEAMLVRALTPNPGLSAELATLGVDPNRLDTAYPTPVWVKTLEAVRRHHYGAMSTELAYRRIGKDFAAGYLNTIVGKVLLAALSFMSPRRFLERAPSYMHMGRRDLDVSLESVSDHEGRLRFKDPFGVPPGFPMGIFDEAFERMKSKVSVRVETRAPGDFDLVFSW